jgi:hypothetical protein
MAGHGREQLHRFRHVVPVIIERLGHRFTHQRKGGEVHDCVNPMPGEKPVQQRRIAQIPFDEGSVRQQVAVTAAEVIQNDDLVAGTEEIQHHVRADVARAADDEDGFTGRHVAPPSVCHWNRRIASSQADTKGRLEDCFTAEIRKDIASTPAGGRSLNVTGMQHLPRI